MNFIFERSEFEHINLTLNIHINTFLTECHKNIIIMHIFYDLKGRNLYMTKL